MKRHSLVLLMAGCVLAATLVTGCALFKKGPTPEELVMQKTQALANDFLAANADKILDYVSDSFTAERVPNKATLAEQLKKAKESGKVEQFAQFVKDQHGQVDLKEAKVTLKGNSATVYPITASADIGSVTVELTFKKDPDKVWRVSGITVERS